VLDRQNGPTIVAGHSTLSTILLRTLTQCRPASCTPCSYGGQIITALGTDAPNVAGLVYIAAFGLEEGESIGGLLAQGPPTPALAHLDIDKQGFAWLPEEQPLAASTLDDVMGVPAWKSHPSWYLVAENDDAIPPDAERQFAKRMGATTIEIPSSHVAIVSHPSDVAELIETAAQAVQAAN
jgi:pimeloyl-ACP methyl ester carboxylesterase